MKICAQCVLPETFPGIQFDAEGVCNYCMEHNKQRDQDAQRERTRRKFEGVAEQIRGKRPYDCVLAYSGGKDSTYTLWLLREHYRLRVLAVTFDNGFISPTAFTNIRRMVETLDADHVLIKPRFGLMKKVFLSVSEESPFGGKALQRASSICNACIGLVKNVTLRIAIEEQIPMVVYGFSLGQAETRASLFRMNAAMLRAMHDSRSLPLLKIAGDDIAPYLLNESHFAPGLELPYNVNLLAFHEYEEHQVVRRVEALGWQRPQDTDGNSSNCLLNAYANRLHLEQYGFHPYAYEVAGLVRCGAISRAEGRASLENIGSEATVRSVAERLGTLKDVH